MQEVSLTHLLKQQPLELDSTLFHSSLAALGPHHSDPRVFTIRATYNTVLDHPLPSSGGTSFPWVEFRDHHTPSDVLVYYHPLCMDNYEFFVGPNISTLSVQSYRVSATRPCASGRKLVGKVSLIFFFFFFFF